MKKFKPTEKLIRAWSKNGVGVELIEHIKNIEEEPALLSEFSATVGNIFIEQNWDKHDDFSRSITIINESISELKEFLGRQDPHIVSTLAKGSGEAFIDISWRQDNVGLALWDRIKVECEHPVILTLLIEGVAVKFKKLKENDGKNNNKMDVFYPERFKHSRKYSIDFSKIYRQNAVFDTGAITEKDLNRGIRLIIEDLNDKILSYPRRTNSEGNNTSAVLNQELVLSIAYGRFAQAGRQIMDFPPGLSEMFAHTDIGGVPLKEVKLPYVCQYLHFGPQKHLEIEPGWYVDGAYVESRGGPGEIKITLTSKAMSQECQENWFIKPEPCYSQSFNSLHANLDLKDALENSLNDRLFEFFKQEERAEDGQYFRDGKKQVEEEIGINLNIKDVSGESAKKEIDNTNRRYPVFLEAMNLIINGILYITSYQDDIEITWPEKAPQDLREKASGGSLKEQEKAKSKLIEMGYSAIHLCGMHIRRSNSQAYTPSEGHKSLHWRRGHWRKQPFGEGRSQIRLRWIMPMKVGKGNSPDDDPELGHLYLIS